MRRTVPASSTLFTRASRWRLLLCGRRTARRAGRRRGGRPRAPPRDAPWRAPAARTTASGPARRTIRAHPLVYEVARSYALVGERRARGSRRSRTPRRATRSRWRGARRALRRRPRPGRGPPPPRTRLCLMRSPCTSSRHEAPRWPPLGATAGAAPSRTARQVHCRTPCMPWAGRSHRALSPKAKPPPPPPPPPPPSQC
ncbi:hypothetical protein DAI22_02g318600 [Oryza sativa Japonica Group]|nr:hypothetical protein DAI22_02g318600 [Oryza sativa Japonica Group]